MKLVLSTVFMMKQQKMPMGSGTTFSLLFRTRLKKRLVQQVATPVISKQYS
jgi:hypothetical protein